MARAALGSRLLGALVAGAAFLVALPLAAQTIPLSQPPDVPKECGDAGISETPLPNSTLALERRKQIKIVTIGASSAALLGTRIGSKPPLLERILERAIKGVDVHVINRGFSGELAEAAGARLKIEVALNHPDLVLWQVGTNDALAQVPVEEFQETVLSTVQWLKAHNIDVILIGLHYMKQLAKDPHYQAIRESLRRIANAEHVLRIGRYEATEVLARALERDGQLDPLEFGGPTEENYNCMAQYLARTIAVGVFAKPPKGRPVPSAAPPPPAPPIIPEPAPRPGQP